MNLLLSLAGRRTDMVKCFKEALGGKGKVFASHKEMTYTLTQADGYLITPIFHDDSYIEQLILFCKTNDISVIIPLSDFDLPILAKNRERMNDHSITVVISTEQVIRTCNDKWNAYHFLTSIGLKQPATYIDKNTLIQDIQAGKVSFPIFIKPRWGTELNEVIQVETIDELHVFYKKIRDRIFSSDLKYISQEDENNCIIMQETIDGEEYGLDILNDLDSNYITTFVKHKLFVRSGITYRAQTIDNGLFENTARLISSNLKHVFDLDVDCFITKSHEIVVVDMNPRIGRLYPFIHIAGVDLPKQLIKWLMGDGTSNALLALEIGVKGYKETAPLVSISQ